jgi:hypothetical protein
MKSLRVGLLSVCERTMAWTLISLETACYILKLHYGVGTVPKLKEYPAHLSDRCNGSLCKRGLL